MPDNTNEVREYAELLLTALLELLPVKGSWTAGYTVEDSISPSLVASPEQWATAAFHFCDLHRALAQQDQVSSGVGEAAEFELRALRERLGEPFHTLASTIGRARVHLQEPVEADRAAGELRDASDAMDRLRRALAATPEPQQEEDGGTAAQRIRAAIDEMHSIMRALEECDQAWQATRLSYVAGGLTNLLAYPPATGQEEDGVPAALTFQRWAREKRRQAKDFVGPAKEQARWFAKGLDCAADYLLTATSPPVLSEQGEAGK